MFYLQRIISKSFTIKDNYSRTRSEELPLILGVTVTAESEEAGTRRAGRRKFLMNSATRRSGSESRLGSVGNIGGWERNEGIAKACRYITDP